jgi:hypothetical protein
MTQMCVVLSGFEGNTGHYIDILPATGYRYHSIFFFWLHFSFRTIESQARNSVTPWVSRFWWTSNTSKAKLICEMANFPCHRDTKGRWYYSDGRSSLPPRYYPSLCRAKAQIMPMWCRDRDRGHVPGRFTAHSCRDQDPGKWVVRLMVPDSSWFPYSTY